MRWKVTGTRSIYSSAWVRLELAGVELPDGTRFEHHVVRLPVAAAAAVIEREGRLLMIHRHRFIPDVWGWEVPAGRLDSPSEDPVAGAAREALEETGWKASEGRLLVSGYPMPGMVDVLHHVVVFGSAVRAGEPVDVHEADRVEWMPVERALALLRGGEVPDGFSQYALLSWLALAGPSSQAP